MITRINIGLVTGERFLFRGDDGALEFENRGDCVAIIQYKQIMIYPLRNVRFIEITEE